MPAMNFKEDTVQTQPRTNDPLEGDRAPAGVSSGSSPAEVLHTGNDAALSAGRDGGAYTSEEEALVEERLRNLGYL